MLESVWTKEHLPTLLVGMQNGAFIMEDSVEVLKKLKIELPYDPAIPLLGIYLEKTNLKRYMHPSVHSSTIYNSQDIEAT